MEMIFCFTDYGLRGSPMFSDLYRSSAIDIINVDFSQPIRQEVPEPETSTENPEPSESSSQMPAPSQIMDIPPS